MTRLDGFSPSSLLRLRRSDARIVSVPREGFTKAIPLVIIALKESPRSCADSRFNLFDDSTRRGFYPDRDSFEFRSGNFVHTQFIRVKINYTDIYATKDLFLLKENFNSGSLF